MLNQPLLISYLAFKNVLITEKIKPKKEKINEKKTKLGNNKIKQLNSPNDMDKYPDILKSFING